ncbi:hypothetical protein GGI25_000943 [Coemansia spiralis]|uniref:Exportin-4 n=2 Tax=Coemansia TaxID=4863 RepID=A0A9W8GAR6_9FUNG|nr:armadillo-type protein [Coemansia spiralis]KAJ1993802.1 hypothetical protein EDC05_001962 [Coemansia umbellata]KAJ2623178.1 hypothetical protein GGI26_002592 [Coemansia sp. RSA 1358]KAJ2680055.1 hypothetical protein GGI25_000943 [Coemansia spiralis]
MDYGSVLAELEQACADFQIPALRFAAEQQLASFGKRPDAIDAGKYVLAHSHAPTAMFFALRGIKAAVVSGYSVLGLEKALRLRDELFQLAMANSRTYASFVLESVCWAVAVITKRTWTDSSEDIRANFTNVLCDDILKHTTPCIGIITTKYLMDEISGGSKCSDLHVPWEFHYSCKVSFENTHMARLFEASLKVLHRQLQRSLEDHPIKPGSSQTIAYERRSALHVAEKVLSWSFTSSDTDKVIVASFGQPKGGSQSSSNRQQYIGAHTDSSDDFDGQDGSSIFNDDTQSRTPLFPRVWQPLLLNRDVLTMFFSVYNAAISDQMHMYFSPGSSHLALQCMIQLSGLRGRDIFGATTPRESDALRIEYAQIIMRNQLQLIRQVCTIDLSSEGSEGIVIATTQMIRRFIESELDEQPLTVTNGQRLHSLALLAAGVPETFEYFSEVSKYICLLLRAASGILESDVVKHIDEDFGDVDNYFVMQAFDELASAWSAVINEIREWGYMEEARSAAQQNYSRVAAANSGSHPEASAENTVDNQSALSSFMQFLTTTAYLIRSDYIQLRMLMCEDSVHSSDSRSQISTLDQGLLAKDYVVYEDQLQFFALLSRLDIRTSMDRLHESLFNRCNALYNEFKRLEHVIGSENFADSGISSCQQTIDLLHEQTHWIVLMIGHTLADSGTSERVLIPQSIIEYSSSCENAEQDIVVQTIMAIFRLLQFELTNSSQELATYISPLLIETLYWAVRRIGPIYLLPDCSDYGNMSHSLISSFGSSDIGGEGKVIVYGILDFVRRTFDQWSAEEDLLHMCVDMLRALSQRSRVAQEITHSPQFTPLVLYLTSNMGRLPESIHSSIVQALAMLACYSSSTDHAQSFSELKTLVTYSITQVIHDGGFDNQLQDNRVVNKLLDGLDMMDGLLSAANFRNMEMTFEMLFEMQPALEKLLAAYTNGEGIPRKVLQVLESAARYLDIPSLPDNEQMLRLSHNIRTILQKYQAINQISGNTVQSSADVDSLGEVTTLISAISYLVRNEMGFAVNEASRATDTGVSNDFGETEVFGLYCIHTTTSPVQLQAPNVLRGYVQLLSEMIQYRTPSLVRWMPPVIWQEVMEILVKGVDNDIYDVGRRTYEAIGKLGAYLKVSGLGNTSEELRQVFSRGIKQILSRLLQALLFSPFDADLVEPAGIALVTLGLIEPDHLQACFRELFASGHSASFAERLSGTLAKFNAELEGSEAVRQLLNSTDTIPDAIDGTALRQPLFEFLVNTRAVLRIK